MSKKVKSNNSWQLIVLVVLMVVLPIAMYLTQQKNDNRNLAASCAEACPVPGGELRNCTPPEPDGSAATSLCNEKGRIEPCGGQQFCCPAPGGQWTTNMSACIVPSNTPTLTPIPTATSTPTLTPTLVPTDTPEPTAVPDPTDTPEPTAVPDPTEVPTATNTRVPTATRTPTNIPTATPTLISTAPYLNFRMSFLGVANNALCADGEKMPLIVTLLAKDGASKVYRDVMPVKESAVAGSTWATYKVGLRLDGFEYKNNVVVFVKGPKHLQVKYGKDNQNAFYNMSGGELMGLTSNPTNSPTFNFTNYPVLAGDVTGATNGVPDGTIDGLDFSFIKNEAIKRTRGKSQIHADTNGNCEMESSDLAWMMLALVDKQEQVY
jgi:hypothetical protein